MKCVHPRKVHRLMEDFLNYACDLFCDDVKTEIILKKGSCFSAEGVDCVADCEELEIEYNLDQVWDEGADLFRRFWTAKVPMLQEFSNITLTLLHELGHLETNDEVRAVFTFKDRHVTWEAIDLLFDNDTEKNFRYFEIPDEASATQWGIDWLADAEHQRVVKIFEQNFMACFK